MRRYWSWLGLNLGKRAGTVAIVGLLVTLALGIGMFRLRFVTSNSSYLDRSSVAQIDNSRYEHVFGGDFMATTFSMKPGTTVDNLFTPGNLAEMASVESRLEHDPAVFDVVSPLDALDLSSNLLSSRTGSPTGSIAAGLLLSAYTRDPSPASRAVRFSFMEKELLAESSIPKPDQVPSNPAWVQLLLHNPSGSLRTAVTGFFPNNTHAAMYIVLNGPLTINQEARAAKSVLAILDSAHFQNATVMTTGVPALLESINSYLKGGMITLTAIAAAIMALILLMFFTVRWRLLPFLIVAVGIIWAFGLVGYFGIPLTLGSIAGLPTLLGIGMDYSIQMHSRIEEEVVLDRSAHPIQASARNLGPVLLVVTVDAVLAFVALLFSKVPMIRQFGDLLVVGIVAVCIFSIVGTLAFLGIREYRSPTRGKDFSQGRLSRLVAWLGSISPRAAVPFAVAGVLIFAGGLAVGGSLRMQTNPISWINPHSTAGEQISALRRETGADDEFGMLVTTTSPFSTSTVDYVARLSHSEVTGYPADVFPGIGIVNLVDQLTAIPGAGRVLPTGSEIAQVYAASPPTIQKEMAADGGHDLNVVFRARSSSISGLTPLVHGLEHARGVPPGIQVTPGGIAVVGVGLLDNLASSRTLLTYLALLFVGAWLAIRLKSVVRSLLSLVPVLIAVGGVTLIAVGFGLHLSPMTAVSGPLVVATCTEFTSIILLRFVEERGRGLAPRDAADVVARRTGRAFMVSAMTAVVGIGVMATSSMPLLRGFGILVALNVGAALVAALVVLPPILIWAEQWNLVTRGLLRGDETPRMSTGRIALGLDGYAAAGEGAGAAAGTGAGVATGAVTEAGWYLDPLGFGTGRLRYFDGRSWTQHVHDGHGAFSSGARDAGARPGGMGAAVDSGERGRDSIAGGTQGAVGGDAGG